MEHCEHNSTNKFYLALVNSYKDMQTILTPTLSNQKQKVISSLFAILNSQVSTLMKLIEENKNDYQSTISSNITSLSKDIAKLLNDVNDKNSLLVYSQQSSLTFDMTHNKIKSFLNNNYYTKKQKTNSTIKMKTHVNRATSALMTAEKNKEKFNYMTHSYQEDSTRKDISLKKTKKKGVPMSPSSKSKTIKVNSPENDIKNKTISNIAKKEKNDSKNNTDTKPKCTLKKIYPRSKSVLNKKINIDKTTEAKKEPPLGFEAFVEKTEKDFEKIGVKPSNYAKYLVKKYKDVVEKFDQIDTEEAKLSGRTLTHKCNSSDSFSLNKSSNFDLNEYIRKNKNKFYNNGRYGFLFEGMDKKSKTNTISAEGGKTSTRIHVMKAH